MMDLPEEQTIICPFDMSHVILKHRMAAHLIKCRRQHPGTKLVVCPFNATHYVLGPELESHTETCSDRRKMDSFLYIPEDLGRSSNTQQPCNIELPHFEENWDEQVEMPSYLDVKNQLLEQQAIFRKPVGMSKAERKKFFKAEEKRFQNFSQSKSSK